MCCPTHREKLWEERGAVVCTQRYLQSALIVVERAVLLLQDGPGCLAHLLIVPDVYENVEDVA